MKTDGLVRSAAYQLNVESVEAPDAYTVVFNLKRPNSRFHSLFTVRWNAAWMMPKHIFRPGSGSRSISTARLARRLQAAQLRPERAVVHLAEA